jgi:hypothetical protein
VTKQIHQPLVKLASDLSRLSDAELLKLRSSVDREAFRRGLSFSVGELGEKLAIEIFRTRPDLPVLALAPRGTKNVDALSRDGERYSIKTLMRAKKTGTVYPDEVDPNRQLFEFLLIVLLSEHFELVQIVALDWKHFCEVRSWDKRMQAWYVAKSKRVLDMGKPIFPVQGTAIIRTDQSTIG